MTLAIQDLEREPRKPPGWRTTSATQDPADETELRVPTVTRVPLHRIVGSEVTLKARRPVEITVERGEVLWFVESETLHVFGSGASIEDALRDFSDQVVHFHQVYLASSEDSLTGSALDLRRIYLGNFERGDVP